MRALTVAVLLAGCETNVPEPSTLDVRVDMASAVDDPDSADPELCVASDGVVYVAWIDDRDGRPAVWLNRSIERGGVNLSGWADVSGWMPAPVKVSHSPGNASELDLWCDELGVYAVWQDDRDGELLNGQVYFNRSIDQGETFDPEDTMLDADSEGLGDSLEPQITGSGESLFVVWYDNAAGTYDVYLNASEDAGATWRSPVRVESDDPGKSYSGQPTVAPSGNGDEVWVAWEDLRDGRSDVYFGLSETQGATFEPDLRLDEGDGPGATDSFSPQVCADPDGWVYVVWQDARNGAGHDIFANYSSDGGESWLGNAVRVDSDNAGFGNSVDPTCLTNGSRATVAWSDDRLGGYDVYTRELSSGEPMEAEIRVDTGTPEGMANSLAPRMATDSGNLVVAWLDERAVSQAGVDVPNADLYYNARINGAPFLADGDLRIDSHYAGEAARTGLEIAVLGGELYAAWADDRAGTWDIWFQRLPIGAASDPPVRDEDEVTP